ncbi:MAG: TIGR03905 family TSCPD domain-containing protein [Clostridia bacterium]|nr:TIGR03905 family TSCPD domain-containing protein [Clostridia bacterium]
MEYMYATKGVCPRRIKIVIDGNVVRDVVFLDGGCNGNLQAVPRLVKDMTVEEIEKKLAGIECGFKGTSCADQLAKAVREAYEEEQKNKNQEN